MARNRLRDWPIICFQFWLKPISEIPEGLFEMAKKQNELWNKLVEIGQENRKAYERVISAYTDIEILKDEYAEAKQISKEKYDELKNAKVKFRTRKSSDSNLQPYIKAYQEAKNRVKIIGKKLKEVRKKAKEMINSEKIEALNEGMMVKINKAIKESGIYWADAYSIKDRFLTAWFKGVKTGRLPKFHAFNGLMRFEHTFTSGGLPIEKIFTENKKMKRLRIKPIDPNDWRLYREGKISQREMKRRMRTIVTTTLSGYQISFKTILHREIPEGSILKKAIFKRIKRGRNSRWYLSLTLEVPPEKMEYLLKEHKRRIENNKEPIAGIDVGFRVIDDNLRVAVLVSGSERKEIFLPGKILKREKWYIELQKKKDNLLEKTKKQLIEMMPSNLPKELKSNWHMARSKRLKNIYSWLKNNDPEHIAKKELEKWLNKENRLHDEMAGIKARNLRHRKWFYYNIAHEICKKYEKIIVEKLDMSKMQRKKELNDENDIPEKARFYSRIAAVSELLNTIEYVAKKHGTIVEKVNPAYTTMKCHVCDNIVVEVDRAKLLWTCNKCGSEWDQDYNAAMNLYKNHSNFRSNKGDRKNAQPSL